MSSPAQNTPAIELIGLTKRFGRTLAVNNLTLNIPRGSTFGLIGPNGAGKSTTIKMLMGMLSITAGEARVLGIDVAADPVEVKQRVGYVPETHHIYRWMRVGEAIGFCKSCFRSWNDQTCREMVELFGLDLEKKVKHLSKGTQVKLALLLAVSHDPELLLLDEPLSGLDPIAREEFLDGVLRTICDRGQTVLDFQPHARRRAAVGRYGGHSLRGKAPVAGQSRRPVDFNETHHRHAPRRLPSPSKRPKARSGSAFKAGSGRLRCAISRRRRFSRSRRSTAWSTSAWSIWAWRNCSRISFEGKGYHNEMALVERLSAQPADRVRGAGDSAGAVSDRPLRWLRRTLDRLGQAVSTDAMDNDFRRGSPVQPHTFSGDDCAYRRQRTGGRAGRPHPRNSCTSMPVTRQRLMASKLLLAFLIAVVIWLNAPAVWYITQQSAAWRHGPGILDLPIVFGNAAITGLTFFCVAWFLSSLIASPTFAICGGLISPLLVLLGFQFVSWLVFLSTSRWPNDDGRIVDFGIAAFASRSPRCVSRSARGTICGGWSREGRE